MDLYNKFFVEGLDENEEWIYDLPTPFDVIKHLTKQEKKIKKFRTFDVEEIATEVLLCPEDYDDLFSWDGYVLGLDMNTKTCKGKFGKVTFHLYIEISEGVEIWSGELIKWSDTCGCWSGMDIFASYHAECGKQQTEVERTLKENGLLEGELTALDIYTIPSDVYDDIIEFIEETENAAWENLHDAW